MPESLDGRSYWPSPSDGRESYRDDTRDPRLLRKRSLSPAPSRSGTTEKAVQEGSQPMQKKLRIETNVNGIHKGDTSTQSRTRMDSNGSQTGNEIVEDGHGNTGRSRQASKTTDEADTFLDSLTAQVTHLTPSSTNNANATLVTPSQETPSHKSPGGGDDLISKMLSLGSFSTQKEDSRRTSTDISPSSTSPPPPPPAQETPTKASAMQRQVSSSLRLRIIALHDEGYPNWKIQQKLEEDHGQEVPASTIQSVVEANTRRNNSPSSHVSKEISQVIPPPTLEKGTEIQIHTESPTTNPKIALTSLYPPLLHPDTSSLPLETQIYGLQKLQKAVPTLLAALEEALEEERKKEIDLELEKMERDLRERELELQNLRNKMLELKGKQGRQGAVLARQGTILGTNDGSEKTVLPSPPATEPVGKEGGQQLENEETARVNSVNVNTIRVNMVRILDTQFESTMMEVDSQVVAVEPTRIADHLESRETSMQLDTPPLQGTIRIKQETPEIVHLTETAETQLSTTTPQETENRQQNVVQENTSSNEDNSPLNSSKDNDTSKTAPLHEKATSPVSVKVRPISNPQKLRIPSPKANRLTFSDRIESPEPDNPLEESVRNERMRQISNASLLESRIRETQLYDRIYENGTRDTPLQDRIVGDSENLSNRIEEDEDIGHRTGPGAPLQERIEGNGHLETRIGSPSLSPQSKTCLFERLHEASLHAPTGPKASTESKGLPSVRLIATTSANEASVLLTSSYRGWTRYSVCLDRDGDIDLLDSRSHKSLRNSVVSRKRWTPNFAVNGAWIGPGELVLVHIDARWAEDGSQLCLIKWQENRPEDGNRAEIRPVCSKYHIPEVKITAIAALGNSKDGRRSFVSGGINPTSPNELME